MKILFITPHVTMALSHGAAIRRWNLLQGLLSVGPVDVIACGGGHRLHEEAAYAGCDHISHIPSSVLDLTETQIATQESNLRRSISIVSTRLPFQFLKGDAQAARELFKEIFRQSQYSIIWVETLRLGILFDVPAVGGRIIKILDGDDYGWVRDFQVLRRGPSYGAKILEYVDILKMRRAEINCAHQYSRVIRCSQEDVVRQTARNVCVIANGADVPGIVNRRPGPRVLFVGLLNYAPNRLGIEWFIARVWPIMIQQIPDAMLDVVGKDPSRELLRFDGSRGITIHGFVEDLSELYERSMVSIVPLHAGGGTRLKILESLGRGVPVVSTTLGAYGIPLSECHGLVRRDGIRKFARECVRALTNDGLGLQAAAECGRREVERKLSWDNVREAVRGVVRDCLSNPGVS